MYLLDHASVVVNNGQYLNVKNNPQPAALISLSLSMSALPVNKLVNGLIY